MTMVAASEVELGKLTRREFREKMAAGILRACILPVGATEQHNEHLAMDHDWRSALLVAQAVAQRLSPHVLVTPPLAVGISEHHMKHPGTLSLRPGTFIAAVNDLVDSLARAGFQHILVLNGHGGNTAPCGGIWEQFLWQFPVNLHFLSYWDVLDEQDARELLKGGHRLPQDLPGHAQEFETALALALFPDHVRQDAVADDAPARFATAETGRILYDRIVERLARYVNEMIDGTRTTPRPVFDA